MMKKILSLFLSLMLLLSACAAFAEEAALAEDTMDVPAEMLEPVLLATVNGTEIMSDDTDLQYWVSYYLYQLANSGYDTTSEDLLFAIQQYSMQNAMRLVLIRAKAKEEGLDTFTEEETAAMKEEAKASWEEIIASYMSYSVAADASDDDKAAARADAEAELLSEGYTEETYINEYVDSQITNILINRVRDFVSAGATVTDEDVQKHFDELVKEDQEIYEGDIGTYEFYTQYYSQPSYYTPEGYRGIIHILLKVDDELLNNWKDLSARYEEQQAAAAEEAVEAESGKTESGETAEEPAEEAPAEDAADDAEPTDTPEPTAEPVTKEMVDAAEQAIMDSVQDKVNEINAKLKDGAAFEDLVIEYGEDPGMQREETRATGYAVHKDSIIWDPAFTAGAMALEKVGDWSDPVLGSKGVHILYYLRDIPGGAIELTDEMKESMREELLDELKDTELNNALDQWIADAEIVYTEAGESWKLQEAEEEATEAEEAPIAEAEAEPEETPAP